MRSATSALSEFSAERAWRGKLTPEKGRPPPGGEEAEVVVLQPRGVGLMHTRHKPSDANYTREVGGRRKPRCKRNYAVTRNVAEYVTCRCLPL